MILLERSRHGECPQFKLLQPVHNAVPTSPSASRTHAPFTSSCRIALALLDLLLCNRQYYSTSISVLPQTYQRPHRAVQRMPVVSPELGVGAFERGVAVGLGLLDAVESAMSATSSIHLSIAAQLLFWCVRGPCTVGGRTRSCAPSSPDCAGTSSSILRSVSHCSEVIQR